MTTKMKSAGGVTILKLRGRIFLGDGDEDLEKAMTCAFKEGHKQIVLDLTGVKAIDSPGLGTVMACCRKQAREKGVQVRLVIPRAHRLPLIIQTVLRVIFGVFDDELQAVASFAS